MITCNTLLQCVDPLLRQITSAVERFAAPRLLVDCTEALHMLRQSDAVAKKVDTAVAAVCENIEGRLVQAWTRFKDGEGADDETETELATVGGLLLRAAKLYSRLDLSGRAAINQVAATLIDDSRTDHLGAEATVPAVQAILACLVWQLLGYTPGADGGEAQQLKIRVRAFTEQLVLLLDHPSDAVKFAAFTALMDALQLFALKLKDTEYGHVAYELDPAFVARAQDYVVGVMESDAHLEWPSDDAPYGHGADTADDADADSGVDEDKADRHATILRRRVLQSFLRVAATAMAPTAAAPLLAYLNDPVCGDALASPRLLTARCSRSLCYGCVQDYAPLCREFLKTLRDTGHENAPRVILAYLQHEYEALDPEDPDTPGLRQLKSVYRGHVRLQAVAAWCGVGIGHDGDGDGDRCAPGVQVRRRSWR
jgi:hypothetical protein